MSGLHMKYFVLNPAKDDVYGEASRKVIFTYAEVIEETNKELSDDLVEWVERLIAKEPK